jgi:preprotein translocase subunit SecE
MAMNREQKRMLQKQGQLGPDGTPMANRQPPAPRQPQQKKERTSAGEFVRGVRSELRKVAWPSRAEVVNLSVLVLVTLGVIMALIFVLDLAFAKSILFLFEA